MPDPSSADVANQTPVSCHAKLQALSQTFLMECMGCIQHGKLTALIVVLKAIINGNKPTHINNGSDFDKIIQFRIGTWCAWPIENPKKRGKDAARLIYEHIKKTHATAKSREQVLTDLHQIETYPFLLTDVELQEMNVIRDKALAGGAVKSTNQLLASALNNETLGRNGRSDGSTTTERQLVLQALGQ